MPRGPDAQSVRSRVLAAVGSFVFLVLAPGTVAGLVPWWITGWQLGPSLLGLPAIRVLGAVLIAAGLPILVDSFVRFAVQGIGTPAPIAPTHHLVVSGAYRFVRNPMYLAVLAVIVGQGLVFGSMPLLAYGVLLWACTHAFVVGYEEPTLRKTFGAEYERFCAHVPRWVPRLRPWP